MDREIEWGGEPPAPRDDYADYGDNDEEEEGGAEEGADAAVRRLLAEVPPHHLDL